MMLPYFLLILLLTIVHFLGERDAPLSILIRDLPRLSLEFSCLAFINRPGHNRSHGIGAILFLISALYRMNGHKNRLL